MRRPQQVGVRVARKQEVVGAELQRASVAAALLAPGLLYLCARFTAMRCKSHRREELSRRHAVNPGCSLGLPVDCPTGWLPVVQLRKDDTRQEHV